MDFITNNELADMILTHSVPCESLVDRNNLFIFVTRVIGDEDSVLLVLLARNDEIYYLLR